MQCSGFDFKLKQIEASSLKIFILIILSAENIHYALSFLFTLPHKHVDIWVISLNGDSRKTFSLY